MFDLNVCGVSVFALKSRMKQLIKQHKSTSHRVIFLYFSSFSSDILHLNAFQTHTPICLTKFLFILSPVHSFMLFSVYYIYSVKLLAWWCVVCISCAFTMKIQNVLLYFRIFYSFVRSMFTVFSQKWKKKCVSFCLCYLQSQYKTAVCIFIAFLRYLLD